MNRCNRLRITQHGYQPKPNYRPNLRQSRYVPRSYVYVDPSEVCPFCHAKQADVYVLAKHMNQCVALKSDAEYIALTRVPNDITESLVVPEITGIGIYDWPLDHAKRRRTIAEIHRRFRWDNDTWLAVKFCGEPNKLYYCQEEAANRYVTNDTEWMPAWEICLRRAQIKCVPGFRPEVVVRSTPISCV